MRSLKRRPRFYGFCALLAYVLCALTYTGLHGLNRRVVEEASCPAFMNPPSPPLGSGVRPEVRILQGNTWLLPNRPLLVPYPWSTDRKIRLQRLVATVRACGPDVVVLQEVFDRRSVALMRDHLPEYALVTSGLRDPTNSVNPSGLLTLSRLPVAGSSFLEFERPPVGTKLYEAVARKGALTVDIEVGGTTLTILNLHAYSPSNAAEAQITRRQIEQVLDLAARLEYAGKRVVLAGDFNIDRPDFSRALPTGWDVAAHGPTYVPVRNPYSVEGANNTPDNRRRRRQGLGTKTVDLFVAAPRSGVNTTSRVLHQLQLSDHEFIYHTVAFAAGDQ